MNITFYQFAKRSNSTKIVNVTGTTYDCQLKSETDMINPSLLINGVPAAWNPIWNYCYIPAFSRYYFINNWRWRNGVWECECAVDVLASWKTEIGAKEEYILRTNSTSGLVFNENVSDSAYPCLCDFTKSAFEVASPFASSITNGCYIIGCITGADFTPHPDETVGAITYYVMSPTALEVLKYQLLSDENMVTMGITDTLGQMLVNDVSKEVLKTMYNPYQYIVSCMWFPFDTNAITDKTYKSAINLGWWSYNVTAYAIKAQVLSAFVEDVGGLHGHPQALGRGNYLNYEPYTKTTLIGRFGTIPINTHYFSNGETLRIYYQIDLVEGTALMKLVARTATPSETLITTRVFQIGVPIQLAQVGVDYMGQAMASVQGSMGALSGIIGGATSGGNLGAAAGPYGAAAGAVVGAATGAVNSLLNGVYNTTAASIPQMETSGANGSFLLPFQKTTLLQLYYYIADEDIEHRGRPVYRKKTINTLSGYVLCAEGDIDFACLEAEKAMISNYLTSGFFYE